ncbi:phosphatase PAP2 family protein [soil metagenome]
MRPRRRADVRLGARLGLAAAALLLVAVPFGVLTVLVRSRWEPLRDLDVTVIQRVHDGVAGEPWAATTLRMVSTVFDPWTFRAGAVVAGVWLWRRGSRRLGGWTAFTVLSGGLLVAALKAVIGRARPMLDDPVATAAGLSFPSGHAFGVIVGCGVTLLLATPLLRGRLARATAWTAGLAVVAVVGFSRVGLGVHFPSDVVGGYVLGLAWLAGTAAAFEAWRRETGRPPSPLTEVSPESAGRLRGSS